jgi:1-acyl-sn-glycerol-3-phosphate acyltransferase
MGFMKWFVTYGCRFGLSFVYRVRKEGWERIPKTGPLLVYGNHTGTIEVPLYYTHLQPRPVTGIGKAELWEKKFVGWIMKTWDIIPVRRGESDMDAMRKCMDALNAGKIFGIAPEGTRSKTGALIRALPGLATLALHTNARLIPVAHWGGENRERDKKRLRRTDFNMRAGRAFRFDAGSEPVGRAVRQAMVDEAMYQLSALLPEKYRGEYADLSKATTKYLRFE